MYNLVKELDVCYNVVWNGINKFSELVDVSYFLGVLIGLLVNV